MFTKAQAPKKETKLLLLALRASAGFTLIEGIIALGIISTALIIGLSLAVSNLTAGQDNSDRVIAGNLAREGVEVVRFIRDTNWIRRIAKIDKDSNAGNGVQLYNFDDGFLYGYVDPTILYPGGFFQYPPSSGYFQLTQAPAINGKYDLLSCIQAGSDPLAINCQVRKGVINNTAVYHQYASAITSTTASRFYRRMIIQSICWNTTSSVEYVHQIAPADALASWDDCTGSDIRIGILVNSRVMWKRGPKTLDVSAEERLYDWDSNYAARTTL